MGHLLCTVLLQFIIQNKSDRGNHNKYHKIANVLHFEIKHKILGNITEQSGMYATSVINSYVKCPYSIISYQLIKSHTLSRHSHVKYPQSVAQDLLDTV